jgi:hypothetical protein
MSYIYKLDSLGGSVKRNDGLCIPFCESNTDYQEYLKWLEAGNTPLPADKPADEISE